MATIPGRAPSLNALLRLNPRDRMKLMKRLRATGAASSITVVDAAA